MSIPFALGSTLTQAFGANPQNYAQFGLNGHEGLDFVPQGGDKKVYAVESGVVVQDVDDPVPGKAYGINVVIYVPLNRRLWTYAHLAENYVKQGDKILRGQPLGLMGNTGNTTGPHLHLGLRQTDANGNPLNGNNGFKGFIDPAPIVNMLTGLEQAVLDRANAAQPWMPVNNTAALWKFAQARGLQDQQTDEIPFTYNGEQYITQVFNKGIVYVKVGDWGNIRFIPK
ncbi:MAG: M23 family metallopeptidase [Chloroflexi bacterium]|nr:M23 family metallopeptidase [Chloroflexota bacterium]